MSVDEHRQRMVDLLRANPNGVWHVVFYLASGGQPDPAEIVAAASLVRDGIMAAIDGRFFLRQ